MKSERYSKPTALVPLASRSGRILQRGLSESAVGMGIDLPVPDRKGDCQQGRARVRDDVHDSYVITLVVTLMARSLAQDKQQTMLLMQIFWDPMKHLFVECSSQFLTNIRSGQDRRHFQISPTTWSISLEFFLVTTVLEKLALSCKGSFCDLAFRVPS